MTSPSRMGGNYPRAPRGTTYSKLFTALRKTGAEYAGATESGGLFFCPVHDDQTASLAVDMGSRGVPVVHCFPCVGQFGEQGFRDRLRALGIFFRGEPLLPDQQGLVDWGEPAPVAPRKPGTGRGKPGAGKGLRETHKLSRTYYYKHASGLMNFRVLRFDPKPEYATEGVKKRFTPQRWVGGDEARFVTGLDDVERTPYKLELFADWADHGKNGNAANTGNTAKRPALYLVEGEKACEALLELKRHATTFHGGAAKEPDPGWVERYDFDRFEVRLWPDNDEPGWAWMNRRAEELRAAGVTVAFWAIPGAVAKGYDAADAVADGRTPKKVPSTRGPRIEGGEGAESGTESVAVPKVAPKKQRAPDAEELQIISKPYPVSHREDPHEFASELVRREFWDESSTMPTIRFWPNSGFWLWDSKVSHYVALPETDEAMLVELRLEGKIETTGDGKTRPIMLKERSLGEVVKALSRRMSVSSLNTRWPKLVRPKRGVPFRNGYLDVETGKLIPLTPQVDVKWSIDADYTPEAKCPEWIKFLRSIGKGPGTDDYRLLRQWFGYLLSGKTDRQKALNLYGAARSGKGTIIIVAAALFGGITGADDLTNPLKAATATDLDVFSASHDSSMLANKALAVLPEVRWGRNDPKRNAAMMSWIAADPVKVNPKYRPAYAMKPTVRFMFASNELPYFHDSSDALPTRFLVMEFTMSFLDNPDKKLQERLLKEIPGIANWALKGLRDLGDDNFFVPPHTREIQEQLILESSPIRGWVGDCCAIDTGGSETTGDLHRSYSWWREENGLPRVSRVTFARDLKMAFPSIEDYRGIDKHGARFYGKRGIRLIADR